MAETKTKPTDASVDAYLASRASPEQLADCRHIMAICKRALATPNDEFKGSDPLILPVQGL